MLCYEQAADAPKREAPGEGAMVCRNRRGRRVIKVGAEEAQLTSIAWHRIA